MHACEVEVMGYLPAQGFLLAISVVGADYDTIVRAAPLSPNNGTTLTKRSSSTENFSSNVFRSDSFLQYHGLDTYPLGLCYLVIHVLLIPYTTITRLM